MPTSFDELDWILKQGVKSIVTMTENALPEEWVSEIGYLHVPTPDLTAPDMEKIDLAVDFIHENITENDIDCCNVFHDDCNCARRSPECAHRCAERRSHRN